MPIDVDFLSARNDQGITLDYLGLQHLDVSYLCENPGPLKASLSADTWLRLSKRDPNKAIRPATDKSYKCWNNPEQDEP